MRIGPPLAVLGAGLVARFATPLLKDLIERSRPGRLIAGAHVRERPGGFGFPSSPHLDRRGRCRRGGLLLPEVALARARPRCARGPRPDVRGRAPAARPARGRRARSARGLTVRARAPEIASASCVRCAGPAPRSSRSARSPVATCGSTTSAAAGPQPRPRRRNSRRTSRRQWMQTHRSPSERARRRPPHAAARSPREQPGRHHRRGRSRGRRRRGRRAAHPGRGRGADARSDPVADDAVDLPRPLATGRGPSAGSGCGPTGATRPGSPRPSRRSPSGLKVAVDVKDGRSMAAAIDVLGRRGTPSRRPAVEQPPCRGAGGG